MSRSAPDAAARGVTLLKLGGSLITDKERPDSARIEVIRRLAAEVAGAAPAGRLVIGHGSGSYGHVAAARHRIHEGLTAERRRGVSCVQQRAADLHRLVVGALLEAGTAPYSIAPSSVLVTAAGRPGTLAVEPLLLALSGGLLPVLFGDVVMDRERGSSIASTEVVLLAVEAALRERGVGVARALWAGATDGVLDPGGRRLPEIREDSASRALRAAGGAAGTDVTGGMRHRVEAAIELARRGVASLIFDASAPGRLAAALRGEDAGGTWVLPGGEAAARLPGTTL